MEKIYGGKHFNKIVSQNDIMVLLEMDLISKY